MAQPKIKLNRTCPGYYNYRCPDGEWTISHVSGFFDRWKASLNGAYQFDSNTLKGVREEIARRCGECEK